MQSPKKVAKYLQTKNEVVLDDTRPPGPVPPRDEGPNDLSEESLRIHSLTPVKVLEKIRNDVISVLGIQGNVTGRFTRLEQKLVDYLERIVRKGQCPSILVKERDLIEAMLALKKYFETDSVAIQPSDRSTGAPINIPVFPALYKYAKEAAFCEQRIRELRAQRSRLKKMSEKQKVDAEIKQLRERKDTSLIYYQKIIFSDAEALAAKRQRRQITIFGKSATLDDLLAFLKQGGRLDQARTRTRAPNPQDTKVDQTLSGDDLDSSLGTFGENSVDDVLDWRKIKSTSSESSTPQKQQDIDDRGNYSFNL